MAASKGVKYGDHLRNVGEEAVAGFSARQARAWQTFRRFASVFALETNDPGRIATEGRNDAVEDVSASLWAWPVRCFGPPQASLLQPDALPRSARSCYVYSHTGSSRASTAVSAAPVYAAKTARGSSCGRCRMRLRSGRKRLFSGSRASSFRCSQLCHSHRSHFSGSRTCEGGRSGEEERSLLARAATRTDSPRGARRPRHDMRQTASRSACPRGRKCRSSP